MSLIPSVASVAVIGPDYTHRSASYSVVMTYAPPQHRGGVEIFYHSEPHFAVEAVEKFGPNVIGFQLATGARRWYIVGV